MVLDIFGSYRIVDNHLRGKLRRILIPGHTYMLSNPKREKAFYIVHPSAKQIGYIQATYFYKGEPWSDILRTSMTEIINELISVGFTQLEKSV